MVKFGIIADTHVKKGENKEKYEKILSQLKNIFKDVDEIIHAGDVCDEWFISELSTIAPVKCVKGHEDEIKNTSVFIKLTIGPYNIGVIHELPVDLETFCKKEQINILIHGHTHYPLIKSTPYKILLLNPGSPTCPSVPPQKQGFQKPIARPTVLTLKIDENNMLSTYIITLKNE
ncbi:MAG: YfcE family phosphodiesterase [Promethearchaeota archaeon]